MTTTCGGESVDTTEPVRKWNVLATCFWIAASGICTAFVVAAIRYAT